MIALADTWLHLATGTTQFVQLSSRSPPIMSFGRGLSPACLMMSNNISLAGENESEGFDEDANVPCNQIPGGSNITEAFNTVNNISTVNQLVTANHQGL